MVSYGNLPNLPGFGRLAACDVCRIADLQQLHKFMAGYCVVKVRFIARIFYIRMMGNARGRDKNWNAFLRSLRKTGKG